MTELEQRRREAMAREFRATLTDAGRSRLDESDDALFYAHPRLVQHLDRRALQTVTEVIDALRPTSEPVVLDLMASHDSHLPASLRPGRVVGLGLNHEELAANAALDDHEIADLNRDPTLPFDDATFDMVINVASIDYLVDPMAVYAEVARVLRPGGLFLVVFSNRMFETKATAMWREASEEERVILVEAFFEHSLAFTDPLTFVSKGLPRPADDAHADESPDSDPVYAVFAYKPGYEADARRSRALAWLDGPSHADVDPAAVIASRTCPHCDTPLSMLHVPEDAVAAWGGTHALVCFEDHCPYFVHGWSVNYRKGMRGYSYRFMLDPERARISPLPVPSRRALRHLVRPLDG